MKNIRRCVCIIMIFSLYWCLSILADNPQVPSINNNLENISISEHNDEIINDDDGDKDNNNDQIVNDLEPSVDVRASFDEEISEDAEIFNKQIYGDGTSQNSGIVNDEMTNNGPPVVVTLVDVATTELAQKAAILPSQNENKVSTTIITNNTDTQQINQTQLKRNEKVIVDEQLLKENKTVEEEIPSFSEWTQKRLEEAEKEKEPQNASSSHHHHHQQQQQQNNYNQQQQQQQQQSNDSTGGGLNTKQSSGGGKLRWKNYASPDCGAKVVASNPEAISPSAILSPSRDEYKLNKCTNRIWFIVELCEAIQAKKIDLANFELFSSSPKDFIVSVSDRFPTRDWINVGNFQANDERNIQTFNLNPQLFSKYIKVEVKSHYGSEHYCPMSLFRVYGTSEFEVLQKEDVETNRLEDNDDDDDDDEMLDSNFGDDESKNLFSSATDAVLSMVKKAAQVVVGNKSNNSNQIENETTITTTTTTKYVPLINTCSSPSHFVVCDNCSDTLFGKIFELLSCNNLQIKNLVSIPFIQKSLIHSSICQKFGFNFQKSVEDNLKSKLIESLFPSRYLGAMCNFMAITENKVVFNTSNQYMNDTKTINNDEIVNIIETSESKILFNNNNNQATDGLNLETIGGGSKVTCSTDTTLTTTQIKPTKTITNDLNLNEIPTQSLFETRPNDSQEIDRITDDLNEEKPEISKDNNTENSGENDENLENFISELNENHTTNTQTTTTTTTPSTPQTQNESVFLRLLNRIKALERNMSLSSQYLEELSKRYKKQVEEMQKTLDKTVSTMTEELKKKDEYNRKLEENLLTLTLAVENLIAEKNNWSSLITYLTFIFLLIFFLSTIFKRKSKTTNDPKRINVDNDIKLNVKRRKSIDVIQHHIPQKRRRRPSDQALKIVHSTSTIETSKRKKRKKLKRSTSIGTLSDLTKTTTTTTQKVDWIESEAKRIIDEIPFVVLEDSEHSTLEPINLNRVNDEKSSNSLLKTAELCTLMNGEIYEKSTSFDCTVNQHGINGNVVVNTTTPPKKEKKSLKKILKKVF